VANGYEFRACDCCRILDGDETPKVCGFCSTCQAWLCAFCRNNWMRRVRAAMAVYA
jgi:hypothetical protein